jgi:hypothetical protein
LGALVALAVIALLIGASLEAREEYCRLCGKWRVVTAVNPLGFLTRGMVVREYVLDDRLGQVLRRLMPGHRCRHAWVIRQKGYLAIDVWAARQRVTRSYRYADQVYGMIMSNSDSFEWLGAQDPEVALKLAETALDPARDEVKFRSIWSVVPWGISHPEGDLVEVRALLGLQPHPAEKQDTESPRR